MVTRYVRIHPLTWRRRIGLRVGVLGCPHTGECGPGFLSVNSRSACGRFFYILGCHRQINRQVFGDDCTEFYDIYSSLQQGLLNQ